MEEIIILFQCLGFFCFSIGIQAYRLPRWLIIKESAWQCKRCGFHPWVGKIPWRRAWQPTPVFLPGESHGQRSLVGLQSMALQSQTQLKRLSILLDQTLYLSKRLLQSSITIRIWNRSGKVYPGIWLGIYFVRNLTGPHCHLSHESDLNR